MPKQSVNLDKSSKMVENVQRTLFESGQTGFLIGSLYDEKQTSMLCGINGNSHDIGGRLADLLVKLMENKDFGTTAKAAVSFAMHRVGMGSGIGGVGLGLPISGLQGIKELLEALLSDDSPAPTKPKPKGKKGKGNIINFPKP